MKNKVIWLCSILLVLVGVIVGINITNADSVTSFLSTSATILGGFVTVVAFAWAFISYTDWQKTQKNSEYEAIIELGKSSQMLLTSTTNLFKVMVVIGYQFEEMTDLEHKLRDGKISHSVSMFEKSYERYSDARASTSFLDSKSCTINDYENLDEFIAVVVDWFWMFRYQTVKTAMVLGEKVDKGTALHCGVVIPDEQMELMSSIGLGTTVAPYQFHRALSDNIDLLIKDLLHKVATN
ncbi:hypothetical protein [Moritella sp. 28]|uniref:hypothetical protein n=1 Tax=Moritella sp. 28 TaxID=2746232 RepID=UPI001BA54742|nr:hypothetical protein [Moritella sp. 28]QUM85978.1 hypothetical protein HWV02_16410 [Moritella sp. 28]